VKVLLTESSLQFCDMANAILESRGIACLLKNEYSSMESGSTFVRPELWVVDDAQFEEARAILREHEAAHITEEDAASLPVGTEKAGIAQAAQPRSRRFKVAVVVVTAALAAGIWWVGTSLRRASAETWGARGYAYQQKYDYKHAIRAYSEAIRLAPDHWEAYYNRGLCKHDRNDFDGAVADFNRVIELQPAYAAGYRSRGYSKHAKNDLDDAIADYTKAIALDPTGSDAYCNRGYAKGRKGDADGAIADFNHAIELNPRDSYAWAGHGRARWEKGELDAAITDFNVAIQLDSRAGYVYQDRAGAKASKGDMAGAMADYDRAVELDANDPYAYANRGNARLRKDDLDGAMADYNRAIALDSRHAYAYLGRGSIKLGYADIAGATADYHRAKALAPNDAFVHVCLGALAQTQGHYEEAATEYGKGVRPGAKNDAAYNGLGSVALALGHCREAIVEYEKALAVRPPDAHNCGEARIGIAWACLQQDDLARAETELTEAARLGIGRFVDIIAFDLGIIRARQGKGDEATALWKKALGLCKGTSVSERINRAIYKIITGQTDEAIAGMREILTEKKLPADVVRSTLEGLTMLKRCPVKFEGLQEFMDLVNESRTADH
jgi:tetratricopeptide (TPR) repeat protein